MKKHHGGHPKHHAPKHHPDHETPFVHNYKQGGHVHKHVHHHDHVKKMYHGK